MRYISIFVLGVVLSSLSLSLELRASDDKRIKVYPSHSKGDVLAKMNENKWAKTVLEKSHESVDKYVDIHQKDPKWILSRMQMYWENHYTKVYVNGGEYSRGEGSALVPTVRFAGARNWASVYATPSLENIKPYMDYNDDKMYLQNKGSKQWEWVENGKTAHIIENINLSIMNKAMYSAFIYWLNGEQKYADFACDILKLYTEGILYREAPSTEINHSNKHLLGLSSFEVIHEGVVIPLCLSYNFLYDYLHADSSDAEKQKLVKDIDIVFHKFADKIIENGVADNNWNVFQARFIAYLALSLEDNSAYKDARGKEYYMDFILNKNAPRQRALKDVRNIYDPNTAMWKESAGYSINTTKDMLEVLLLVDSMGAKEAILKEYKIIEDAAYASSEYEFPNMRTSAFGDGHYQVIDSLMYEILLSYYAKYEDAKKVEEISAIVNQKSQAGLYNREKGASLFKLFNYVDKINTQSQSVKTYHSAMFYAPNVNLSILRNGFDKINGLMLVNAGTGFNHNNNNGINLELYGKGYALGIDKGRGSSYWQADHREYYNAPISHNTVIVDGVSKNNSPEMKKPEDSRHRMHFAYPSPNTLGAESSPAVSCVDNEFDEQSSNSRQRRFNSIIRSSPTCGYYVDIFRSAKRKGGDKSHDYIYHNLGQSLSLFASDSKQLELSPSFDLNSKAGNAKGYDYLKEEKSIAFDNAFKATFKLDLAKSVSMDMWVAQQKNRKVYTVKTPKSLKGYGGTLPKKIDEMEVPAVIIRKYGEAWNSPFVAIYQAYFSEEGSLIKAVNFLNTDNAESVAIEVLSKNKSRELIINSTSKDSKTSVDNALLKGLYAVVSHEEGSAIPKYIFKAEATGFKWGDVVLLSPEPNTVFIEWLECDLLKVDAQKRFCLEMPTDSLKTIFYIDNDGKKHKLEGSIRNTPRGKKMSFDFEKDYK